MRWPIRLQVLIPRSVQLVESLLTPEVQNDDISHKLGWQLTTKDHCAVNSNFSCPLQLAAVFGRTLGRPKTHLDDYKFLHPRSFNSKSSEKLPKPQDRLPTIYFRGELLNFKECIPLKKTITQKQDLQQSSSMCFCSPTTLVPTKNTFFFRLPQYVAVSPGNR